MTAGDRDCSIACAARPAIAAPVEESSQREFGAVLRLRRNLSPAPCFFPAISPSSLVGQESGFPRSRASFIR